MKEVSKKLGENKIYELNDILLNFSYFYNYTFENNFDYDELKQNHNYLTVEILYPTHVYENMTEFENKYGKLLFIAKNQEPYDCIKTSEPIISQKDEEYIKNNNIEFPAKYYLEITKESYNYKLVLKFDNKHYLISNVDLFHETIQQLLNGEVVNETDVVEANEIYLRRIVEEIKNNKLNERQKLKIVTSINEIIKQQSIININTVVSEIISFYSRYYNEFPRKISQGIDVELFKIYINELPLIPKSTTKKEIINIVTKYVSSFFLQ
jgi:hypothetical protein